MIVKNKATIFSLVFLFRNILGHPLHKTPVTSSDSYDTLDFYERLFSIGFLVLLGGVFAGTIKQKEERHDQ